MSKVLKQKLQFSPNSMEKLHSSKIFFPLHLFVLLHLLQFSSLSLQSSDYTLPDKYFINCGSNSDVTVDSRKFVGDENSDFCAGKSSSVVDTNSSTATSLYKTARVFTKPSSCKLQIDRNGTYLVRLHFYPLSSQKNLFNARFDVSAAGFSLLSNFSAQNSSNSPEIEEFLLTIEVGKFTIDFKPSPESSFAFVNAIEVFLVPDDFFPDYPIPVISSGGNSTTYNDLLSCPLRVVHRINVGGAILTHEYDTLWRNWVPDDDYLLNKDAAKNSEFYSFRPHYQPGGATEYTAPDLVYQTAKEMDIDPSRGLNFFNISWRFSVSKNARHFVRVHFCDILSQSPNLLQFNLYVYSNFSDEINPYNRAPQLAAPFYIDFLVESDNSRFMNISVGPRTSNQTAFLNGLEIMELIGGAHDKLHDKKPRNKNMFLIVGLVVGGVVFLFISMGLFSWVLKSRKAKAAESLDWQPIHIFRVGSSYSRTTERTASSSPAHNLNLGLRLSFVDIQHATNNFDPKLMIGEGGFGKVYKGTLRDGTKVAVKRSEPGHGQGLPEFQTEIMVLSRIRHRHLVSLIGYCDERSEMVLVYEFMEKGTLRDHLYNWSGNSDKSSTSRSQLSWIQRLEICIGAAKGLHYLHTSSDRGIIHRDVKSTNILLDERYVAKVADFGLSRLGALDQTHVSTEVKGSFGYLDPEYFKWLQLTQKSDVYSFGVVLLEVLCARQVINSSLPREQVNLADWGLSCQKKGQLEKIVDPLLAGKINPNSLRMFGEIVEKCLKESGSDRPSMHDVLWDLEYALQLQQIVRHREPHEDSTSDTSSFLPVPVVQRLLSDSMPNDGHDIPMADFSGGSYSNVKEVFSQLRMDDAR